MKILGISLGHDTNFSLIQDGEVIQVYEAERFYRQKDINYMLFLAIKKLFQVFKL